MKTKKVPLRMCLGCGEMLPKRELIRVVKSSEGEISLDVTGKKPGRGAYVCKKHECFVKMRKSRRLESKLAGSIPPEVYEKLEEELQQYE